jgi:hypothetical protein
VTKYTWIVTRDTVLGDSSDAIGRIGPPGATGRARFDQVIVHGEHFRLVNGKGEPQFVGYILGEYEGGEPLVDYGESADCVAIEYEVRGSWISLDAFQHQRAGGQAVSGVGSG